MKKLTLSASLLLLINFVVLAQWNNQNFTGSNVNFQPTTSGGTFLMNFHSNVNNGSDKGFILFQDESGMSPGTGGEDVRLTIGVYNDFRSNTTHSDELWFQGGGRMVNNVGSWDSEYITLIGTPGSGITGGFEWRVNNDLKMILKHDGNVGINTTNPLHKLDVNGELRWGAENDQSWGDGLLTMNSGWSTGKFPTIGSYGGGSGSLIMLHNPHIPFRTDNSSSGYSGRSGVRLASDQQASSYWDVGLAGDFFHIFRNNSGEFFRIDNAGRVGIGTTNTSEAFLTVNGDILSKEVRVESIAGGPDYVFKEDYDLSSLEEVDAYIQKNKHLPEVPSAKEMEENGIELAQMNMLLLKKIEELTLHVIELKKQNDQLREDVDELKKND